MKTYRQAINVPDHWLPVGAIKDKQGIEKMETRKQQLLDTLWAFVNQRPGLEPQMYNDYKGYRAESRAVTRDLHDFRAIVSQIGWRDSITADDIIDASKHAFSGRLEITELPVQNAGYYGVNCTYFRIDYTVGQYMPTEYRKAATAVLASALWNAARSDIPKDTENRGDFLRNRFAKEFGRGVSSRYFG